MTILVINLFRKMKIKMNALEIILVKAKILTTKPEVLKNVADNIYTELFI